MHPQNGLFVRIPTIDFGEIRETERKILQAERAVNTRRAYASSWKAFLAWCAAAGRDGLPAEPATVQDHVTWCIARGYRLATVFLRLSAIAHYHREANLATPYMPAIRCYLEKARRELQEEPRGKAALTYELLRAIAAHGPNTPAAIRNKALVLLGFASGWRRSELIALQRSHVQLVSEGIALYQRSSKTDQQGKGRLVGIDHGKRALTCPVRALEKWLALRGDWDGPLFTRLSARGLRVTRMPLSARADVVNKTLKQMLEEIGENPHPFGAHSLRAGMITEAAKHHASESAIMRRTGQRCVQTVMRYIRPAKIFEFNPLKGVL